jgi:hypothetical protein
MNPKLTYEVIIISVQHKSYQFISKNTSFFIKATKAKKYFSQCHVIGFGAMQIFLRHVSVCEYIKTKYTFILNCGLNIT